jgi:hypothetical protein
MMQEIRGTRRNIAEIVARDWMKSREQILNGI